MFDTRNLILSSVYMTSGRNLHRAASYEYQITAYEIEPSNVALDGEAFPITLQRGAGYASKAQAHSAGLAWCAANLPSDDGRAA